MNKEQALFEAFPQCGSQGAHATLAELSGFSPGSRQVLLISTYDKIDNRCGLLNNDAPMSCVLSTGSASSRPAAQVAHQRESMTKRSPKSSPKFGGSQTHGKRFFGRPGVFLQKGRFPADRRTRGSNSDKGLACGWLPSWHCRRVVCLSVCVCVSPNS